MLKILIKPEQKVRSAIEQINSSGLQILLVVDEESKLVGTVTDGDIRRAILRGISLDYPVREVMNPNPKVLRVGYSREEAEEMFLKYGIKRIPVLDDEGRVVDLLFIEDFVEKKPSPKDNIVVIMAGGRGKRLDPLTRIIPKPLTPIGDKSMLEHIIERFASQGFRKFILTLHYKKEMIKMYLKDLNLPYEIDWVEEEEPLGTAGGLALVREKISVDEPLIVTNCDVLLDVSFEKLLEFHAKKKAALTLVGALINVKIPYGILKINDGYLESIEEKPSQDAFVNTGVYVISPEVLKTIPKQPVDMPQLIEDVIRNGKKVAVYPYYGEFFDIGQWEFYRRVLSYFR